MPRITSSARYCLAALPERSNTISNHTSYCFLNNAADNTHDALQNFDPKGLSLWAKNDGRCSYERPMFSPIGCFGAVHVLVRSLDLQRNHQWTFIERKLLGLIEEANMIWLLPESSVFTTFILFTFESLCSIKCYHFFGDRSEDQ